MRFLPWKTAIIWLYGCALNSIGTHYKEEQRNVWMSGNSSFLGWPRDMEWRPLSSMWWKILKELTQVIDICINVRIFWDVTGNVSYISGVKAVPVWRILLSSSAELTYVWGWLSNTPNDFKARCWIKRRDNFGLSVVLNSHWNLTRF